ncbi:MAG: hypothetical protein LAT57_03555 [Balneolales bacterium]|nr:hypothetical protein [Balneolales bacterium]
MGKYLSGEYSKVEAEHFEAMICQSQELNTLVSDLQKVWDMIEKFETRWDTETSWNELNQLIESDAI